jgi:hypothetical protein
MSGLDKIGRCRDAASGCIYVCPAQLSQKLAGQFINEGADVVGN